MFATGHAAFSSGPDVVCAAVSALVLTLVSFARQRGHHVRYFVESGKAFLSCNGIEEAFDAILAGLGVLAAQYPENLELSHTVAVDDKQKRM